MNQQTLKVFKEPNRIGFSQSFPNTGEPINKKTYNLYCLRYPVQVEVFITQVTYGTSNEYTCRAVVTNRIDISHKLPLGGFASHCHIDEVETMKEAAKLYCEEEGIELCQSVNNWPSFKAICQ